MNIFHRIRKAQKFHFYHSQFFAQFEILFFRNILFDSISFFFSYISINIFNDFNYLIDFEFLFFSKTDDFLFLYTINKLNEIYY